MFKFRPLAPVLLIASTFFAPAQAATIDFATVVVDYAPSDDDTPFLGLKGNGSLTYADEFVAATGSSLLKAEQLTFSVTSLGQEFTNADVEEQLPHFALFLDGELNAFSFVITEEIQPSPAEIEQPGVLAIGSAPHGIWRDLNGDLLLDLWVNGPIPNVAHRDVGAVPLPGGLILFGTALAALGHLRRYKKAL